MTITALPTPPSRADPTNFAARGDAFMVALVQFVEEFNAHIPTGLNGVVDATTLSASGVTTLQGNVVVGGAFSPSAWAGGRKAVEFGAIGNAIYGASVGEMGLTQNYYHDGSPRFAGTGYAQLLKESNAGLEWFASSVSGTAGNVATMVKRFGVSPSGAVDGITRINMNNGADASYIEFSRDGFDEKGSIGVLGGFETNLSHNMDYVTGVHRLYDQTKPANWIALGQFGVYHQYAPATAADGDVWGLGGSLYNSFIDNDGNIQYRGHIAARAGIASGDVFAHSPWSTGRALELGGKGNGVWGAGLQSYVTANYYFNAAEKFAADGFASYYQQSLGNHDWYSSSATGLADATATMNLNMRMSQGGVLTLPAYGAGGGVVTVGAADSGGSGFRALRVPN